MRTGGRLRLIEASSCGALVETVERLLPGRQLDVHIISVEGRVLVRSRVLRSFVWSLGADSVQYRAALVFDRLLDVRAEGYALPPTHDVRQSSAGIVYPVGGVAGEIEFAEPLSA